jgi:hypothetical protein
MEAIQKNNSSNLIQVSNILEQDGWSGPGAIGSQGNTTLFLVRSKDQGKIFTHDAAGGKKWQYQGSELALLEDREAIR